MAVGLRGLLTYSHSSTEVPVLASKHTCSELIVILPLLNGYINIWEEEEEVATARYRHGGSLQGHRFAVLSLVSVGRLIVSGSEDATIRVCRRKECWTHACLAVM